MSRLVPVARLALEPRFVGWLYALGGELTRPKIAFSNSGHHVRICLLRERRENVFGEQKQRRVDMVEPLAPKGTGLRAQMSRLALSGKFCGVCHKISKFDQAVG